MPDLAAIFLTILATALALGWYWERQRTGERAYHAAQLKAELDGLRAELQQNAQYEALVHVMGMLKNVADTRAAEPESVQPIVERKLAEAKLFDLAEQRNLQEFISNKLNGKRPGG